MKMYIYVLIFISIVCGIKLERANDQCLRWQKRVNIVNKVPAEGNYLTTGDRLGCANKCSAEAGCVAFFFTDSSENNCLLQNEVIDDDAIGELVDVNGASYFVLEGFKDSIVHQPTMCASDDTFRTDQLSDGTSITYGIFKEKLTQADAKQSCVQNGSSLIRITTLAKLNLLKNLVKCPENDFDYYIDGSNAEAADKKTLDGWVMENGENVPMTSEFWNGEPNTHKSRNCMKFDSSRLSFDDTTCSKKHYFICEKN